MAEIVGDGQVGGSEEEQPPNITFYFLYEVIFSSQISPSFCFTHPLLYHDWLLSKRCCQKASWLCPRPEKVDFRHCKDM